MDINDDGSVITLIADGFGSSEWSATTGLRLSVERPAGIDVSVISPDGKLIAADGVHDTAGIYEVASGRILLHFDQSGKYGSVFSDASFSPDGKTVALTHVGVLDGGYTVIWNVENLAPLGRQ